MTRPDINVSGIALTTSQPQPTKLYQCPNLSYFFLLQQGAEYFGVKINIVAVDPVTQKLDVSAMKRAINRRTCMVYIYNLMLKS